METQNESRLQKDLNTGIRLNDFDREWEQNKIIVPIYLYMVLEFTDSFWGYYYILSILNLDELQAFLKTKSPGVVVAARLDVEEEKRRNKTHSEFLGGYLCF